MNTRHHVFCNTYRCIKIRANDGIIHRISEQASCQPMAAKEYFASKSVPPIDSKNRAVTMWHPRHMLHFAMGAPYDRGEAASGSLANTIPQVRGYTLPAYIQASRR